MIIECANAVTLIGGGQVQHDDFSAALSYAPTLIAADGGADRALMLGYKPVHLIGDLDSASEAAIQRIETHHISDQDSTDLEKCLYSVQAPFFIGIGFMGDRIDHELAALHVCAKSPKTLLLLGKQDIIFQSPTDFAIDLPKATRFSLFPMTKIEAYQSEGLLYPLDGLCFEPLKQIGTSNEVTGPVRLSFERAGMLVILPRVFLPDVLEALELR